MTNREQAAQNILDSVSDMLTKSHELNYEKLHVHRDGSVSWFESSDRSSDIIDPHAGHFAAIPSVCTVGTGNIRCNCDYCQDDNYASLEDAIADAVGNADSDAGDYMLTNLDAIEIGYFDDEKGK